MGFEDRLRRAAIGLGSDFFGVADLTDARAAVLEQAGEAVAVFPRAISVGITLISTIVDQLPRHADRNVALGYRHHWSVVNGRLDEISSRLSGVLQGEGFSALPVPASQTVDDNRLCGLFSHKLAAHLAGLGWIGKSCLLVTPEAGPRVRWATVLTDAPLKTTARPLKESCGACEECLDACPAGAFTGRPFSPRESREYRFDAHRCKRYHRELATPDLRPLCGMCVYSCPYGQ